MVPVQVLAAGKKKTAELTARLKEMAGSSMAANFSMDGGGVENKLYQLDTDDGVDVDTSFYLDIGQRDRKSRGGYNVDSAFREQVNHLPEVCVSVSVCMLPTQRIP
jgi:hypothetical protein